MGGRLASNQEVASSILVARTNDAQVVKRKTRRPQKPSSVSSCGFDSRSGYVRSPCGPTDTTPAYEAGDPGSSPGGET